MGSQKLLLPWPQFAGQSTDFSGHTVLDSVLTAWTQSQVDRVVVILRQTDPGSAAPNLEADQMNSICKKYPVEIVFTKHPHDMKASVLEGIRFLQKASSPRDIDGCFLAPADIPTLTCALIDQLLNVETDQQKLVQPVFGKQKGHPVRFPWSKLIQAFDLGIDQGIDTIVKQNKPVDVQLTEELRVADIDTMQDYLRLLNRYLQG